MALEFGPLEEERLSPAVRGILAPTAPPQLRAAVAKGLAPLPPADLATAIFQLAHSVGPDGMPIEVAAVAAETAKRLPDRVLQPAIAAPTIDPRVIDFFARSVVAGGALAPGEGARPQLVQQMLLSRVTADETVAWLASVVGEAELEIIAQNEARLLRHPPIIAALYANKRTRMSTATRAVELAIRNNVRVDGIGNFEELRDAILDDAAAGRETTDEAFASAVAATTQAVEERAEAEIDDAEIEAKIAEAGGMDEALEELPTEEQLRENPVNAIKNLSTAGKVRLATLGNAFARSILVRDKSRVVAMAVVRSPTLTDNEVVKFSANRELHEDIIRYISRQRDWTRLYTVKRNLVFNPKCPMQTAMTFLPFLTPKDLVAAARAKSIPNALAKAAQGLAATRQK